MSGIRIARGRDVPQVPTWMSLGPDLRPHATRWVELGPMTMGDYASRAPRGDRAQWLLSCQQLRRRGALVRAGRVWVCEARPSEVERMILKRDGPVMVDLDEYARQAALVFQGLNGIRGSKAATDSGDTYWLKLDNDGLSQLWHSTVLPLSRWQRKAGAKHLSGWQVLARALRPLMVARGFTFDATKPNLKVIQP